MFSIILGENGIPVEPGRKAVWEAIWHALRGPKWMEMMENPYKTWWFLQNHRKYDPRCIFCTNVFFCTYKKAVQIGILKYINSFTIILYYTASFVILFFQSSPRTICWEKKSFRKGFFKTLFQFSFPGARKKKDFHRLFFRINSFSFSSPDSRIR